MRSRLEEWCKAKRTIAVNFSAAAGTKLVSTNGTIAEVGDDYMIMTDIYNNTMLVPFAGIAYIELKK